MTLLGNGLQDAEHHADALIVREAELAMRRRLGASEDDMIAVQNNLANAYCRLGRLEDASSLRRDVYSGCCKLKGKEHVDSLRTALNYAVALHDLERLTEAKALLRKTIPVAQRVLGANDYITLMMKMNYSQDLYQDDGATLDDLSEAVTTLEESARTARRVFGGSHPVTAEIELSLRESRVVLRARETPGGA